MSAIIHNSKKRVIFAEKTIMNIFSFSAHFTSESDCRNHFKSERNKVGVICPDISLSGNTLFTAERNILLGNMSEVCIVLRFYYTINLPHL